MVRYPNAGTKCTGDQPNETGAAPELQDVLAVKRAPACDVAREHLGSYRRIASRAGLGD